MLKFGLAVALAMATPAVAGERGMPIGNGTVPGRSPGDVLKSLATFCVKGGAAVDQLTEMTLVCAQPVTGVKGAITQALLGNAYSTAPVIHLKFTAIGAGADTLLQISQSLDMTSAFGRPMNNTIPIKPSEVATILAAAGQRDASAPPLSAVATTTGPKFGVQFAQVPDGLYVRSVTPESPAAAAKVVPGMVITHLNGVPLAGMEQTAVLRMLGAFQGEATFTIIGVGDVKMRKPGN